MKCLSLWQPWASLVAVGAKRIETRGWSTSYRGPLAIHAASQRSMDNARLCDMEPFRSVLKKHHLRWGILPRGYIIAVCELVDILPVEKVFSRLSQQEFKFGDYRNGRFAWMLKNIVPLTEPVSYRGRQKIFELDPAEVAVIQRLLPEVPA